MYPLAMKLLTLCLSFHAHVWGTSAFLVSGTNNLVQRPLTQWKERNLVFRSSSPSGNDRGEVPGAEGSGRMASGRKGPDSKVPDRNVPPRMPPKPQAGPERYAPVNPSVGNAPKGVSLQPQAGPAQRPPVDPAMAEAMNVPDSEVTARLSSEIQAGPTRPAPVSPSTVEATMVPVQGDYFPIDLPLTRIQGGETLTTFKVPRGSERVEYFLTTDGRPMKAKVQLWLGPLRQTHELAIDSMDGNETPVRAILKFKKGDPALKIGTTSSQEFPVWAGARAVPPARNEELSKMSQWVWDHSVKTLIQGCSVPEVGGRTKGAVRTFRVPEEVESVQLLFWSKDVGKKSLKAKIEVLQGPDTKKQEYDLQCGGGSQPYHFVISTPGYGSTLLLYNKKFLEDGHFQCAVLPYETVDNYPHEPIRSNEEIAMAESLSRRAKLKTGHRWWDNS